MIAVSIVEDDSEIRESLEWIVNSHEDFVCLSAYGDAETAIDEIARNRPDVVLMDITLPGLSGIDCARRIKRLLPDLDILMLTVHEDDDKVFQSLCAGACGYLTKNTPPAKLLDAIREVHLGGAPMSTSIARKVVTSFRRSARSSLTNREQEVLNLLCQGKSYKMIADALFISKNTVRTHLKNVYRKLEVNSSSEAVAEAFKQHLVR